MADMKYFCSKDKAYHKGPGAYQHQRYVADMVKLPLTVLHPAHSTNVYHEVHLILTFYKNIIEVF